MSKTCTVATDGLPPADTKIVIVEGGGNTGGKYLRPGDIAYITPNDISLSSGEIVVSPMRGENHGCFVTEWTYYKPTAIDSLTDEQRQALTKAALESAEKRGYCDETRNILSDLGLPTTATVNYKTVILEVEVTVPENRVFKESLISYSDYSLYDNKIVVTNIRKVSDD